MNKEEWKTIKEAPDCEISNFGNVRTKTRTIIDSLGKQRTYCSHPISYSKKKTGYLEVALPISKGKRIYRLIHRLVLMTFCPCDNMENLEVNHKDENKKNNKLDNLQWVTSKENCNYGKRNQIISEKSLKYIIRCIETNEIFNSEKEAAEKINRSCSTLCRAIKQKWRTCAGYHWEKVLNE